MPFIYAAVFTVFITWLLLVIINVITVIIIYVFSSISFCFSYSYVRQTWSALWSTFGRTKN